MAARGKCRSSPGTGGPWYIHGEFYSRRLHRQHPRPSPEAPRVLWRAAHVRFLRPARPPLVSLARYLLFQHLAPFAMGFGLIVFVLVIDVVLQMLDQVLSKGLVAGVALQLFVYNLAWIVALAVPMAVLIAVMVVFGRLAADNELLAMKAAGISFSRVITPVILAALVLSLVMIWFNEAQRSIFDGFMEQFPHHLGQRVKAEARRGRDQSWQSQTQAQCRHTEPDRRDDRRRHGFRQLCGVGSAHAHTLDRDPACADGICQPAGRLRWTVAQLGIRLTASFVRACGDDTGGLASRRAESQKNAAARCAISWCGRA